MLPDLAIDNLTVRFGGLVAVDGVSINAPAGTITGLIGPNGAGKTTIFNACTGVVSAAAGHIRLGDLELDHLSTPARAARGTGPDLSTHGALRLHDGGGECRARARGALARRGVPGAS